MNLNESKDTVPAENPPENSATKTWTAKQLLRKGLLIIGDLRLAIILLLAIAFFSISGTVIEQGEPIQFYQANYPENPALFGFVTWKVVKILGLDRVYKTWWFLSILILFGSSLTACTFTHQFPALKAAQTWKFYEKPRQYEKLALSTQLSGGHLNELEQVLQNRRYRVFREGNKIYARKGLIGKIGPIIVHASMLIILAGAIWGTLTGIMAQQLIPSGDSFSINNIIDAGPLAQLNVFKDWSVKVNRFWIEYQEDGKIDQFYSDLSVLDNQQQEVDRQTIHVNKPLRYRGVTLYQTDWSIAGIKVRLNNSPVLQLPMGELKTGSKTRVWGSWIPTKTDLSDGVSVIAIDLQGTVLLYGNDGKLIGTARTGSAIEVNGINLTIVDLVGSTGLQIKSDPGIPIVYTGFGLLMVGVMMSYFSHSQIWALQKDGKCYIGGRTNRALVTFEREVLQILEQLNQPPSGGNSLETSSVGI